MTDELKLDAQLIYNFKMAKNIKAIIASMPYVKAVNQKSCDDLMMHLIWTISNFLAIGDDKKLVSKIIKQENLL